MREPSKKRNVFLRLLLGGTWLFSRTCRGLIYLGVAGLVIAALVVIAHDDTPEVETGAALRLPLRGRLVEQLTQDPMTQALDALVGGGGEETLLRDVLVGIEQARSDPRIAALVLELDGFDGAWLTKLQDVGRALQTFRRSGKRVVAVGSWLDRDAYYLAAHADEILLHPMGAVELEGYAIFANYYKDALEKLKVDVNVFRVGTCKEAVEPYLRNDMSDEARAVNEDWLGDLWQAYLEDVAAARGTSVEALDAYRDGYVESLERAQGDPAQVALEAGLVDTLASRVEGRRRLADLVGLDRKEKWYRHIDLDDYLQDLGLAEPEEPEDGTPTVAVLVARGTISGGTQPPGSIGGESLGQLISQCRRDDDIRAIVLRVDSGGGSAFASEVIREELTLAREEGTKVVISMGSIAASGGYWIATAADEIWAHPTTITGSIGIYGMVPTCQRALADLGVHTDGVRTTSRAGGVSLTREMPEELRRIMQLSVEDGYRDFLERVATSRGMTTEEVEALAEGRVYSGVDAHGLGLVDQLGSLEDAIAAAARLAGLGTSFEVEYPRLEPTFQEELLEELLTRTPQVQVPELVTVLRGLGPLLRLDDPRGLYALALIPIR
jgi:protease-4